MFLKTLERAHIYKNIWGEGAGGAGAQFNFQGVFACVVLQVAEACGSGCR